MDQELELEIIELGDAKEETKGVIGINHEDSDLPNRDLP